MSNSGAELILQERGEMKREILINPRGTDFVPACEGCGHPPHGVFCPTRTEASNGGKDICLCEAGYGKTVSPESGGDFGGGK